MNSTTEAIPEEIDLATLQDNRPTGRLREQSRTALVNEIVGLRMLCSLIAIAFESGELKGTDLFVNLKQDGKQSKVDLLAAIKGTLESVVPE